MSKMDPIKIKFFDILKGARIRSSLPETCEEIDRHENRHDSKIRDFLYDEIAQYGVRINQRIRNNVNNIARGIIRMAKRSWQQQNFEEIKNEEAVIVVDEEDSDEFQSDTSMSSRASTRSGTSYGSNMSTSSSMTSLSNVSSARGRPRTTSPSKGRPPSSRGSGRGRGQSSRESIQSSRESVQSRELRSESTVDSESTELNSILDQLDELKAGRHRNQKKNYKTFWFHLLLQVRYFCSAIFCFKNIL